MLVFWGGKYTKSHLKPLSIHTSPPPPRRRPFKPATLEVGAAQNLKSRRSGVGVFYITKRMEEKRERERANSDMRNTNNAGSIPSPGTRGGVGTGYLNLLSDHQPFKLMCTDRAAIWDTLQVKKTAWSN